MQPPRVRAIMRPSTPPRALTTQDEFVAQLAEIDREFNRIGALVEEIENEGRRMLAEAERHAADVARHWEFERQQIEAIRRERDELKKKLEALDRFKIAPVGG